MKEPRNRVNEGTTWVQWMDAFSPSESSGSLVPLSTPLSTQEEDALCSDGCLLNEGTVPMPVEEQGGWSTWRTCLILVQDTCIQGSVFREVGPGGQKRRMEGLRSQTQNKKAEGEHECPRGVLCVVPERSEPSCPDVVTMNQEGNGWSTMSTNPTWCSHGARTKKASMDGSIN